MELRVKTSCRIHKRNVQTPQRVPFVANDGKVVTFQPPRPTPTPWSFNLRVQTWRLYELRVGVSALDVTSAVSNLPLYWTPPLALSPSRPPPPPPSPGGAATGERSIYLAPSESHALVLGRIRLQRRGFSFFLVLAVTTSRYPSWKLHIYSRISSVIHFSMILPVICPSSPSEVSTLMTIFLLSRPLNFEKLSLCMNIFLKFCIIMFFGNYFCPINYFISFTPWCPFY